MLFKKIWLAVLCLTASVAVQAQDISGRDFWFTMPENSGGTGVDNDYIVTIVSDYCADYTIEMPALGWSQTGTLAQGVPNDIVMPKTISGQILYHNQNNVTQGKGIHVTSTQQVTVYMFMMAPFTSDAETVIPTYMLGTEYAVGFNSAMRNGSTAFARTTVVATEDNTQIVVDTWNNAAGAAGAPGTTLQRTKTLNRGQTYQFRQSQSNSSADFQTSYQTWGQTASRVVSDKPIAVVSSVPCSDMADCGPCDGMMTMVMPVNRWGNRYIIAQAMKRGARQYCGSTNGVADFVQVIGKVGTNVRIQSLTGDFNFVIPPPSYAQVNHYGYGYFVYNNDPYDDGSALGGPEANGEANMIVTSDQPIEIVQYMKAGGYDSDALVTSVNLDPESIVVYPESMWTSSYLFTNAAGGFAARTKPTATLVIKNDPVAGQPDPIDDVFIDGVNINNAPFFAQWQAFGPPAENYMLTRVDFAALTSHQVISRSGYNLGIYIYATASAESYVYQGGSGNILENPCPDCPVAEFTAQNKVCLGDPVNFVDKSVDPIFNIVEWEYDFGDTTSEKRNATFNPTHIYNYPGLYNASLSVINDATPPCTTQFFYSVDVKPLPIYNPGVDTFKCELDTLMLDFGDANPIGTAPFKYTWSPNTKIDNINIQNPSVYSPTSITYSVKVEDFHGCEYTDEILISIGGGDSIFMMEDDTICFGDDAKLTFRLVTETPGYEYDIKVYDGTDTIYISNLVAGIYVHTLTGPLTTTTYKIVYAEPSNGDESCIVIQPEPVVITVNPIPDVTFAPDTTICFGDSVGLRFSFMGLGPWEVEYSDENQSYTKTVTIEDTTIFHAPTSTMVYTLNYVKYTSEPVCLNPKTDKITVNVNPIPTVSWVVPTPICQEDTSFIDVTIVDGVAPFYVLYSVDGVLDSVLFTNNVGPNILPVHPLITSEYILLGVNSDNTGRCGSTNSDATTLVVGEVFKAGRDTSLAICTSEQQDLFALLGPDADNVGVWTDVDGSGGSLSPVGQFDPANVTTGTYRFRYDVDNDAPCVDQIATITLDIYEDPTASFTAPSEICAGTDADLIFTLTGTGPFTLNMEKDNVPFVLFPYSNGQKYSDNLTATSIYDLLSIIDGSPAGCSVLINQTEQVVVNQVPQLFLDSNECDAAGENYEIYLDVVGGDPTTYQELAGSNPSGGSFYENPIGSGNWRYKSASIPTQTAPNIIIDDAKGCGPVLWKKGHACNCKSDAGEIDATPQIICGNDATSVTETSPVFLDGNDVSEYYLYTSFVNIELIDVLDSNATGVFVFNATSMTYGTTYYLVRVVGTEASPIPSGTVDRKDYCLSYSSAIPVTFYPTPAATWIANSPVCEGDVSTIAVDLTTGTAPYSVTYNPGAIDEVLINQIDVVNLAVGQLPVGNNYFDLIKVIDANGCQLNGTPIATTTVVVNPLPTVSLSTIPANATICEGDSIYIKFDFTGTAPYDINYTANAVTQTSISTNDDPHTQTFTPVVNTSYQVIAITDGNNCIGGTGNVDVVVNTNPTYTISADKTQMCEGDVATITFNIVGGNATYDIEYTSDNPADAVGTITNISNGGTFTISPNDGTFQYVFGDISDGSPTICSSVQSVTYNLTVFPTAKVAMTLTSNPEICAGEDVVLTFTTTEGTGPFDVSFEDDLGNTYNTGSFGAVGSTGDTKIDTLSGLPAGQRTFSNVTVTDGSGICVGISTDQVVVDIYSIPSFTVSGGGEFCQGYTENIAIVASGDRPMSLSFNNPEGSGVLPVTNGNNALPVSPPNGTSTYNFASIEYTNAPVCLNANSKQVQYLIHQTAIVNLKDNYTICAGESIDLTLEIIGGTPPFNVVYSDGGQPIIHPADVQNGSKITVTPSVSTKYTLLGVTDQTTPGCSANLNDSNAIVTVNTIPVATINSPSGICFGDEAEVSIQIIEGAGTKYLVSLEDSEGRQNGTTEIVDNFSYIDKPLNIGSITYSITGIADNTMSDASNGSCISTQIVNSITVVNPLPEGELTLKESSICAYDSTSFSVDINNGSQEPYNIYYTVDNVPMQEAFYFSGNQIRIQQMPAGKYAIEVYRIEDSADPYSCTSEASYRSSDTLVVNPQPIVKFDATVHGSCTPLVTEFLNLTDESFKGKAEWSLDRGKVSLQWDNVEADFVAAGFYDIKLTVTSDAGCVGSLKEPDYVQVYPDPVVDFIYQPNPATLSNSGITFRNTTVGGSEFQWSIDTISGNQETSYVTWPRSTENDHYYYFNDENPGEYQVLLESWSKNDCRGNIRKLVSINGELLVNIPNSFTPNGDGVNDYFRPYMFGHGTEFSLHVYNRWGEELFAVEAYPGKEQSLEGFGWDGTDNRNGEKVEVGTYIYRMVVQNKYSQKMEEFIGEVNLLK